MSEQQRNYEQQQNTPKNQAEAAKNQLQEAGNTKQIDWNLEKSKTSLRATLVNAWINVDANWNTNIDWINCNIKDLRTRDALWQPDKLVITDSSWSTLTILDKNKPNQIQNNQPTYDFDDLKKAPTQWGISKWPSNNFNWQPDRVATQVRWQHAYDRQWNDVWLKDINHWNKTIDISKASQYRQEGAWIKWPDWSNIWPANITVWEWKQINLMDLIKWNLRQEWAWLKDTRWNVLCASNDPKFMQYKNLFWKWRV